MREIANFAEPLHLLLVRWKEYIESDKWKSLGEEKDYVVKNWLLDFSRFRYFSSSLW